MGAKPHEFRNQDTSGVFATDYPQEIRSREAVRDFVTEIRALGERGEQILSGNSTLLLKRHGTM